MSAPHEYHQPNAPDEDSDLELDLEELDPLAASSNSAASPPHRPSKEHRKRYHELGARIPLRNLRVGRLRSTRRTQELEDDDLRGLIEDDHSGNRSSGGSLGQSGDDDIPLLPSHRGRRRDHQPSSSALSKLGSSLRLPSFMSSKSSTSGIQLGEGPEGESDAEEEHDPTTQRTISVGQLQTSRFPANAVSNAKYTPWSFLPRTLYNEFSFFINLYFLLVAMSQIIPALRIGYLSTYIFPLAFVITITLAKEALDDIARRRRDAEANSEGYTVLKFEENNMGNGLAPGKTSDKKRRLRKANKNGGGRLTDIEDEEEQLSTSKGVSTASYFEMIKPSRNLKVGDVVKMGKDQRVPADMVILKSYSNESTAPTTAKFGALNTNPTLIDGEANELLDFGDDSTKPVTSAAAGPSGEAFIRTDQLDGETDWKLRLTSPLTQNLDVGEFTRLQVIAGKPDRKVNEFYGTIQLQPKRQRQYDPHEQETQANVSKENQSAPLNIDNTVWANTVLASSCSVLAVVVYTGPQTRQALSTSASRSKTGLLEYEINSLTKFLCVFTLSLSFILVALAGFREIEERQWYVNMMRFLILFSTIVPVGLRVNLDMGKSVYAWFIEHDQSIPGTVVRTSTIPEDLGRIEYLLSDKTGTLTQNGMSTSLSVVAALMFSRDGDEEDPRWYSVIRQRSHGRSVVVCPSKLHCSGRRNSQSCYAIIHLHRSSHLSNAYAKRDRIQSSRCCSCLGTLPQRYTDD
jgi:phospholipid-translocating ATPase